MIFSKTTIEYFMTLGAKVDQGKAKLGSSTPYFIDDDPVINGYECLREVWLNGVPAIDAYRKYNISRSSYYKLENRFIKHGFPGIFPYFRECEQYPDLESLVLLVKKARPNLSITAIFRIAQAIPCTRDSANTDLIAKILLSHGYSYVNLQADRSFWDRIQRTFIELDSLRQNNMKGRTKKNQRGSFFIDNDIYQQRIELLRQLFYHPKKKIYQTCRKSGVAMTNYYRLVEDYHLFGPWAVIPGTKTGQRMIDPAFQLNVIVMKLRHPSWSAQQITGLMKTKESRFVVNRVFNRWGLADKGIEPVALEEFLSADIKKDEKDPLEIQPAIHRHTDTELLSERRINRHFEIICKKMKTHAFHICDPGPILLAPFVNDLGVVQAFEDYGPPRLRGKEITNLALLNIMRIIAGYRRINHLADNRDRSVAFAGGVGMFGSNSKFYEDTIQFKFDHIYKLRCDLVKRAVELGIIEGLKVGFDFHFKEFYGKHAAEKGIGKGPDKSGNLVPGFRPHIAWDLASNVIISMAYYQGATRSPRIIRQFCEQNIFSVLDRLAIEEIYMDSEYTKEGDLYYFKEISCTNSEVFICLKKNPQVKKFIKPALAEDKGWEKHDHEDQRKAIRVTLPKTKLPLKIVILRDYETHKNIRCFASTDLSLNEEDILKKYRYRWVTENGIKDLVHSYFADEIYGSDPEKIEFEFYCIMVARLAYEYFLKEMGDEYLRKKDGNKHSLSTMRNLIFEKRNCLIEQNSKGNIGLTVLDSGDQKIETDLIQMYSRLEQEGKNKVLWWGNRGIELKFKKQYEL